MEKESFDYINIKAYKEKGDQKAFNRVYKKYFRYCHAYSLNIYRLTLDHNHALGIPDILGQLMEKCFLNAIEKTDLNLIQPNYDFKVRLSGYLKAYTKSIIKDIKKYGYVLDTDIITNFEKATTNSLRFKLAKKLSYNPTPDYLEQIESSKETLIKNLNKKEIKFIKYLEQGKTLGEISTKMNIPMGSMGAFKKQVKEKCYQILEVN